MTKQPKCLSAILLGLSVILPLGAAELKDGYLTFDNQPMGSTERPLVLRTFIQNLDLDKEVMAHHAQASESPKYSAKTGLMNPNSDYKTISGIPAAISVNVGPQLSYAWDTTECRLLYGWANGFLDMSNYWGTEKGGRRVSFGYVPYFIGNVFYKAKGKHPLRINGKALSPDIAYLGHTRVKGHPHFQFQSNGSAITVSIMPGPAPQTMLVSYTSSNQSDLLDYQDEASPFEISKQSNGFLAVLLRPNAAESYAGYKKEEIKIETPTVDAGQKLYATMGCAACHTLDGGKAHGPSFKGLFGSKRPFVDGSSLTADDAYLRESILKPAAKSVVGYPVGMMPPYQFDDKQVDSLILYIKTVK